MENRTNIKLKLIQIRVNPSRAALAKERGKGWPLCGPEREKKMCPWSSPG
jgi:hypothetical protein